MPTKREVLDAGAEYRDALVRLTERDPTGLAAPEVMRLVARSERALAAFADRPAYGERSPAYDPLRAAIDAATAGARACDPADRLGRGLLDRCAEEVVERLATLTAPARRRGLRSALRGSLRIERVLVVAPATGSYSFSGRDRFFPDQRRHPPPDEVAADGAEPWLRGESAMPFFRAPHPRAADAVPLASVGTAESLPEAPCYVAIPATAGSINLGPYGLSPMVGAQAAVTAESEPPWLSKLVRLFPAESLLLYAVALAVLGAGPAVVVLPLLGLTIAVRAVATQPVRGGRPDWGAVLLTAVGFLLWVTAIGDPAWTADLSRFFGDLVRTRVAAPAADPAPASQRAAAGLAVVWTLGASFLKPARPPTPL